MNIIVKLILVFLFSLCCTSRAQLRRSNITRGSSLTPKPNHSSSSSWLSSSGLYAFGFYPHGNCYSVGIFVAGVPQKSVVWTFSRDSLLLTSDATLQFTSEGRLVLRSSRGVEYIGDQSQPAASASMLDSGNFVFFTSDGRRIWESFDHPTDTLLPTQRLLSGNELISSSSESFHSSGFFRLKMQTDGNLVQYHVNTPDTYQYAYYSSLTYHQGNNVSLVFSENKSLFLVNSAEVNILNISDFGVHTIGNASIYRLTIDPDGIFRIYSYRIKDNGQWKIEWSSTNDKCNRKGICGLNGFCVQNDQVANCGCLPGFDFVQQGNWTSGCVRNFTANSCKDKAMVVSMEEVPNTSWLNNEYSTILIDDKDGCARVCIEDCNCEAAFYQDRECQKQSLPLRFGRRSRDSKVALVKVYAQPVRLPNIALPTESHCGSKLIASIVFMSFGFVMMAVSLVVIICKNKIRTYTGMDTQIVVRNGDAYLLGEGLALRSFTLNELERMTGGFEEEIGKGSFGKVYKGRMISTTGAQQEVAVKRLERVLEKDGNREREFQNEMRAIGKTHHKNLVRLLGYCHEGPHRVLVYEYMSQGSLAEVLFRSENRPSWEERLEMSCEVARGILYLHEECETQIIHCDIKPQNILVDESRRAKISDFGLAKLMKPDQTRTFTGIRGTRGYVAPEWHRKHAITTKADVYSFGVVLLEMVCCRRNVDWELPEAEAVLEEWAYECFERGELRRLVQSEEETTDFRQLERMVRVSFWCIQDDPSLRPSMKKVVLMLEGTVDVPIPPSPQFFA